MNKGILYAAGAYVIWGFFPIFLKTIQAVPAAQIMTHRIAWSFILLLVLVILRSEFTAFRQAINRRTLLIYLGTGILLAINWLTYVWAVNSGFVVEASLGYFINPLVNVLLGVVFLKERLRAWQWLPIGLAAAGVVWLTVNQGALPWFALVLATSFGLYGLIKKVAPLGSLPGTTLETGLVFLPALGFLILQEVQGVGAFGHTGGLTAILLALTGVVTATPLLLFAAGARLVPLSTMGILQYISPSLQFLSGIFLFGETFTPVKGVGFALIWLGLILYTIENLVNRRQVMNVHA